MKQRQFEHRYAPLWESLKQHLDARDNSRKKETSAKPIDFPAAYRQLCHHIALARRRDYSPVLIERLTAIALNCHQALHKHRGGAVGIVDYALNRFPATVRRHHCLFWISALAFFGPMFGMGVWVYIDPDMVFSLLDGRQVASIESMYRPENSVIGRERADDGDLLMFGFYIKNNASIGLQTLAGGLLAGVGTLFFLIYNGLYIGAIGGYLTEIGYGNATFFPFVSGHAAMELTAIAMSGAAGLLLAKAIVIPGIHSRRHALRMAAREAAGMAYGIVAMFVLAALIEAFWSASSVIPREIKYAFGALQWLLVISYFVWCGRRHGAG